MKTFITFIFLICAAVCQGQFLPNNDFEKWAANPSDTLPTDWGNSYFGVGRTTNSSHGDYAVTIWNWYSYAKGRLALGGKDILEYDLIRSGIEYPIESSGTFVLTGEYKYVLGNNGGQGTTDDSAVVFVLLKKYNKTTGQPDTVAYSIAKLGPSATYKLFSIPVYVPGPADSLAILFYSSEKGFCSLQSDGNCLYLTLDNLNTSFFEGLGVSTISAQKEFAPFPNPFIDAISFGYATTDSQLRITNSLGGQLYGEKFTIGDMVVFDGRTLPSGMYFYSLTTSKGTESGKVIKK